MNAGGFRAEEARRKSQERLAADRLRAAQALKDRDKAQAAEAAKTTRLRALRLAKEASDKEAADRAAAVKASSPAKPAAA
jgi:hypothetical protein